VLFSKSKIPTFFLNPIWNKGRAGLEKGLGGAEATLVSGSFLTGVVGGEGFLEEEVSDFGGFTPFTVSIPSTVTVFPGGSFSAFSSFFPNREQEARVKRKAVNKIKMIPIIFLF